MTAARKLDVSADAGAHYDLRGLDVLPTDGPTPVANMGYWGELGGTRATTLHQANLQSFRLVLDAAGIRPNERVLDAGCGFGTLALAASDRGARVTGLNLSEVQLAHARKSAAQRVLGPRFVLGSATDMPVASASMDAVISVEAAFHFDARERFFEEAARVLAPGGRMVLVDLVLAPPRHILEARAMESLSRRLAFPMANVYGIQGYADRVRAAGLEVRTAISIQSDVVPPFRRWMLKNALRHRAALKDLGMAPYLAYPWDYVFLVAGK
jgi:cyclopropane fatty-acyl-phospholipid synthase-like methyltransferase